MYSSTRGAAILSGSDPPMSWHTYLWYGSHNNWWDITHSSLFWFLKAHCSQFGYDCKRISIEHCFSYLITKTLTLENLKECFPVRVVSSHGTILTKNQLKAKKIQFTVKHPTLVVKRRMYMYDWRNRFRQKSSGWLKPSTILHNFVSSGYMYSTP